MKKVYNEKITSTWLRPWNIKSFDDLYNRDDRFFAILIKGFLSWMNSNILLYDEPIIHFIFNTGSSYMYVETNGYTFSMTETSGEDSIYMKMPRCVVNIEDINIPTEELSAPAVRGTYERRDGNEIKGYNALMRRLPIELSISAQYVLSNFNESVVLVEELINNIGWQTYFNIIYLGQIIECSIEIDNNYRIEFNKVDMTSPETNQKTINIQFKVCSNYPVIDVRTEVENKNIISSFKNDINVVNTTEDKDYKKVVKSEEASNISTNNYDRISGLRLKELFNKDKINRLVTEE